jgi:predicted DNA-binding transcriptional regulator AlpA
MSAAPEKIDQLAAALRLVALGGRELWGFDEIASYSKFERNYVVNYITAQPDFPKPIRLGKERRGHPRYIAHEVMTWFESFQERA